MKKLSISDLSPLTTFFCNNNNSDFFDPFELSESSAIEILKDRKNLYYGWFSGDDIVGFGMIRWYKDYSIPTLGLIVDGKHRGVGLGKDIYRNIFIITKEFGCEGVIAIIHKDNGASLHVARSLGMSEVATLKEDGKYDFIDYSENNPDKIILIKKN